MDKNVSASPTRLSRLPVRVRAYAAIRAAGDLRFMFFLLRMSFWLGLVLVLLPFGAAQRNAPASDVTANEAISAASATVGDLRGFCNRQPDACTIGSQVATAIGYRAQAGAKILYDALSEAVAPRDAVSLATTSPRRSGDTKTALDKSAASQNTLTPTDLAPIWRGPTARKDGKRAA